MVQEKKQSVTSGPSTNKGGVSVIEVEDLDDLMKRSSQYLLDHPGQALPKYVIKDQSGKQPQWAQRA